MANTNEKANAMQKLVQRSYNNRFWITVFTLFMFLVLAAGIGYALVFEVDMSQEWKEILLLVLGAFIGSYGKVIDFWFNNSERDRELIERADHEDDPPPLRGRCNCTCPDCRKGEMHHHHVEDVPHGLEP